MGLNVNYTSLYKNGIDASMLKEVSKEILNRAAVKSSKITENIQFTNNNTRPVEMGVDLYQGRIDTNLQKQIAMNNALQFQLNAETLNSIKFLNSQAAISNRIDGKYMPNVNAAPTEVQKFSETNKSQFMSIYTERSAKDREGSNPFYGGELLMENSKNKDEQHKPQTKKTNSLKSIFA